MLFVVSIMVIAVIRDSVVVSNRTVRTGVITVLTVDTRPVSN
jgi:hypothetical protein